MSILMFFLPKNLWKRLEMVSPMINWAASFRFFASQFNNTHTPRLVVLLLSSPVARYKNTSLVPDQNHHAGGDVRLSYTLALPRRKLERHELVTCDLIGGAFVGVAQSCS